MTVMPVMARLKVPKSKYQSLTPFMLPRESQFVTTFCRALSPRELSERNYPHAGAHNGKGHASVDAYPNELFHHLDVGGPNNFYAISR